MIKELFVTNHHEKISIFLLLFLVIGCENQGAGKTDFSDNSKKSKHSRKEISRPVLANDIQSSYSEFDSSHEDFSIKIELLKKDSQSFGYESLAVKSETSNLEKINALDEKNIEYQVFRSAPFWIRDRYIQNYQKEIQLLELRKKDFDAIASKLSNKESLKWQRDWMLSKREEIASIKRLRYQLFREKSTITQNPEKIDDFKARLHQNNPIFHEEDIPILEEMLRYSRSNKHQVSQEKLLFVYRVLSQQFPQSTLSNRSQLPTTTPIIFQ